MSMTITQSVAAPPTIGRAEPIELRGTTTRRCRRVTCCASGEAMPELRASPLPSSREPTTEAGKLLRRLESWPFLRIERRGACAVLHSGVADRVIGTLDLATGTLTTDLTRDLIHPLLEDHPRLQVTGGGVRLDVVDVGCRRAAEALVRWRIDVERFATQMHCASP